MQIPAAHLTWLPHIVLSKKELFPTILSLLGALAFFNHAYHHILAPGPHQARGAILVS